MSNIDDAIETLVRSADRLKAAGVTRFRFGEFEVWLSEPAPDTPTWLSDDEIRHLARGGDEDARPEGAVDPLDDPDTFGGRLPGFPREQGEA